MGAGYGRTKHLPYVDNNMRAEFVKAAIEFADKGSNLTAVLISPSMSGWVWVFLNLPRFLVFLKVANKADTKLHRATRKINQWAVQNKGGILSLAVSEHTNRYACGHSCRIANSMVWKL